MATRTVSVQLKAEIGSYIASMSKASAATMRLGESSAATNKKTRDGFDIAGKGALLMGGAVVAGIGMATAASMNFEKSMSAVQAATQATAGTLGDLREAAMRAGADTQYSATEAANAITEMSKAGVSAKDIMGGGLSGALDLAAAGQLDVASAAEIASVAMQQFNLAGEDLPHVADLLAAGAGKAMGSVEDLGMALNQSGLLAAAAGMSIEETTGALAAFANAGLVGSDAGTSLKTALQMLQAPTEKSSKLMEQLGLDFYDSNGGMISMSEIAGQLSGKLSGLTEEQRNAALAQIFGSDAVRAANVLYKEGASGIADWTAKVNDSGYAQEQARALTDNLAGDIERLTGSFDTFMISLGSGTQGPLREVVQALTGMLDLAGGAIKIFQSIPTPVLAGVAAFAAVAALKGPVGSAFDTIALKAMYARDSVGRASISMEGMNKAGGSLVSMFGGPWGVALAAGAFMATSFASDMAEATSETDRWAQALLAGGQAAETARQQYADDDYFLRGLDEWIGLAASMDEAGKQATELYEAMSPLEQKQADVARTSNDLQLAIDEFGLSSTQAKDAAFAHAVATAELETAQNNMKAATEQAAETMGVAAEETRNFKDEASEAKKGVDELKAALDALTGTQVSMFEAQSALQSAVEDGTGALQGMTGATLDADGRLNAYSESGRKAGDVLIDVRDKGNELIAMMVNQGDSADAVGRAEEDLRSDFLRTAEAMGITGRDAERLADQILGIPSERTTRVFADTSQATRDVENFVSRISGTRVTLTGDFQGGPGVIVRRAQGGPISGPGTGTSDSIPALLSNGEYVVNAAATSRNRAWLEAINSGTVAQFAKGGIADAYSVPVNVTGFPSSVTLAGGVAGNGSLGGGWSSIFNAIKALIPQARNNSAYRPGDPGYHGRGKAVDFGFGSGPGGAGSPGLALINRTLHDKFGANLAELIYDGIGDDRPDLKNGRPLTYSASTRAQHKNHVHAAVYDRGGWLQPGYTMAYNGTGAPERVLTSREFSGGGGRSGGGARSVPNVTVQARVFIGNREITDIARVEATAVVVDALTGATNRGAYNG